MVATKHTRPSPPVARFGAASAAGTDSTAIQSLLRQAEALVLRAPELTVVCAERAASLAEAAGSDELWVRAEALAVSGRVRLGLRAGTVGRAVAALRAAEDLDDPSVAAGLRTDLALCARSVGVPLMGLAAVRPVLAMDGFTGAGKAAALSQLVGCLSQFGRKPELDRTLAEADKLSGADESLDGDNRLLARALVRVEMSAHRRRHVDVLGAGDAARTGLGLLDQLDDPSCDGGVVRVRLILHLVCSLLDRGDAENARDIAETLLAEPARAASVAPLGWLRMAVATRILLPAGAVEAAGVMLRDAVHSTERHGLYSLNSRLWAELAHIEERLGRASEAIECLHQSRAAEHVHTRSRRQATGLLTGEFGHGGHAAVDLDEILGGAGSAVAPAAASVPETVAVAGDRPAVVAGRRAAEVVEPSPAKRAVPAVSPVRVETPAGSVAPRTGASGVSAPASRVNLAPVEVERVTTDEPLLAPPPADDPAARGEALPGTASGTKESTEDKPKRKTRHDSEHGSVAARSVLDRLGISPGATGSGGRRRAADESDATATPGVNGTNGHSHTSTTNGRRRSRTDDEVNGRSDKGVESTTESFVERASTAGDGEANSMADTRGAGADRESAATGVEAETADAGGEAGRAQAANAPAAHTDGGSDAVARREAGSPHGAGPEAPGSETRGGMASVLEPTGSAATDSETRTADAGIEVAGTADVGTTDAGITDAETADVGTAGAGTADGGIMGTGTADAGTAEAAAADAGAADAGTATAGTGEAPALGESDQPVVNDPWLPRLRLPPSLEPFEDFGEDSESSASEAQASETQFTSMPVISDDFSDSFPREYTDAPPLDEELPADAGLADLLARALAEHQAGTTSAAALVKRLGNQGTEDRRTVNGHNHANGETPNGRHRGGRDR